MPFADNLQPADGSPPTGWVPTAEPPTPIDPGDTAWSDYPHTFMEGAHGVAADVAQLGIHSAADDTSRQFMSYTADREREAAGASHEALTPAAKASLDAPWLSAQTAAHPLRAVGLGVTRAIAPTAAMVGPALVAAPLGPIAVGAAGAVGGALVEAGQAESDLAGQGATQDEINQSGVGWKSAVIGAGAGAFGPLTGLVGRGLITAGEGKLVTTVLKGGLEGMGVMGAQSGAQTYVSESAAQQAGVGPGPTPESVGGATLSGMETGLGLGVIGGGHSGAHRDPTQTGGKASTKRTPAEQRATEAKPRAATAAPADPTAGASTATSPVADPTIKAAADAAAGKTAPPPPPPPPPPTPVSKEAQAAPVIQSEVAQPPPGPAARGPEGVQTGDTTAPPPPPPPGAEAGPAPAPAPAPPAPPPPDPAVLGQQFGELLDPNHNRDAVIYPKGAQVPDIKDISNEQWRYGKVKLPSGATVIYDHSPRSSGWRKASILAADADGSLAGKVEARAAEPRAPESVAGAQPAAVGEAPVTEAPAAAATAAPPVREEIQTPSVEPTHVSSEAAPKPTVEEQLKAREAEKAAQAKATEDAAAAERAARTEALKREMNERLARGESVGGEKTESEKIREAAEAEAAKLRPAQPAKRVLEDVSDEGRAAAERQRVADAEAAARVAGEAAAPVVKEPKPASEVKAGKKSPKDVEHMKRMNAIASEVVKGHEQLSEEDRLAAINPSTTKGGGGARLKALNYVKELLEKAKAAGFEFKDRAMHRTDEETQHNNAAMILYEAKLLAGAKAADRDYGRFFHNEHRLRHEEGRQAYKDILKLRSETGKEKAAERGKPTGEAKAVEDVEKAAMPTAREGVSHGAVETPDITDEMEAKDEAAKEKAAEEEVAKEPGEAQKETPLQKQAREASERALAKLAEQEAKEKAGPRERPTQESGEEAAPVAPKAAVGFKVEARGRAKADALRAKINEAKKEAPKGDEHDVLGDEEDSLPPDDKKTGDDKAPAEGYFRYRTGPEKADYVDLKTSRPSGTIGAAIHEFLKLNKYAPWLAKMVEKLRDAVVDISGDIPVHFISHDELVNKLGRSFRGVYRGGIDEPYIILNTDKMSHDTPLHEGFHDATLLGIEKNPALASSLRFMRNLLEDYIRSNPGLHTGLDADTLHRLRAALQDDRGVEMLTYMMTNEDIQNLFKGAKLSASDSKQLGIAAWLKKTMWEGALNLIRRSINAAAGREVIGPRETPAIAAMMQATEEAMYGHPRGDKLLYEAAARNAKNMFKDMEDVHPAERDQDATVRSYKETFSKVMDIDRHVAKQFSKDTIHNMGGGILRGTAKLLSGTWLNDMHGHLFEDAKGKILEAINDTRNRVTHLYSTLMSKDKDIINRAYMLDKIYASHMAAYAHLVDMSVRYNIHADRDGKPPPKNLWDAARNAWQRDKYGEEARAIYKHLPEDLQKRYVEEKKYYVDKQSEAGKILVNNIVPMFDAPKGRTSAEVLELAQKGELTDADWNHYEKMGVADVLHEAYRLQGKKDFYANSQRGNGRFVVTGRYEMPKGGSDVGYDGEKLRDDTREFDTEQAAHAYVTGTRMKAVTRAVEYYKDPKTGEVKTVSGDEAASIGTTETKYRVRLERQNYQVAESRAEAARNRQAMEADGVGELSGVMDRRDERSWSELNSADQKLLEKKIDSRTDLSDFEKQQFKDISRQMMLTSRGGMSAHMVQARKVAGARFDSAQGLHAYAKAINFHIARNAHAPALDEAMSRMEKHEKSHQSTDPDNALRRSTILHEYKNRVYGRDASPLGSKVSPLFHRIMTWAFVNFLARPSHIILSQIHPYIYSVPMMAARHGYWKSLQGQYQAMKDLGGMGHNLKEGVKAGYQVYKSGSEQNIDKAVAMARGVDPILRMINGLKDKTERDYMIKMWETEHLHSAFDASVFEGNGQDRMNSVIRQFTDAMEANNRLSTALNAFRLERDMHKDNGNALAYSRRVIEQTHGVFSPTNTASVFKNPLMRGVMQFRQQPMNLAVSMYRNIAKSLPEKWGGGDSEARWTLAYQLGTAAALGGMGGMPMDLPKLVGVAGQALGGPSPSDWDDKFYRGMVDNFGKSIADFVHDGIPGLMGPYGPSIGHRAGWDAGMLFGEPKSDSADDVFNYFAKDLAGASVGMGMDWLNALHQGEQGNWERAAEYLMPGSLKDFFKTYRNATQGVTAGKSQISLPSFGKQILQSMGFSDVESERLMAGHFALQKEVKAQQQVQDQLKAKHASRQQTVLGVKIPKKMHRLGEEYGNAYQ